jgi:hypothetical protein
MLLAFRFSEGPMQLALGFEAAFRRFLRQIQYYPPHPPVDNEHWRAIT